MRSTVPADASWILKAPDPSTASWVRLLFAGVKLVDDGRLGAPSPRYRRSVPMAWTFVTVTFRETARASDGMPQAPVTANARSGDGAGSSAGAPSGPAALRVSISRHGGSV